MFAWMCMYACMDVCMHVFMLIFCAVCCDLSMLFVALRNVFPKHNFGLLKPMVV